MSTRPSRFPIFGYRGKSKPEENLRRAMEKALDLLQHLVIPRDRIKEKTLLASGAFGDVWSGELVDPSSQSGRSRSVAIKKLVPSGETRERVGLGVAFARELKVWAMLDHENILPLLGFNLDFDASVAIFISPYEPHGNIKSYMAKAEPSWAERLELAIDTAEGLAYLHSRDICHGDIKAANVIINGNLRAMLGDFGLAKVLEDHPSGLTTVGFDEGGTLRYLSPELVNTPGMRRNLKTDVWAWGGLGLEILTDELPYKECRDKQVMVQLLSGNPPASSGELKIPGRMQQLLDRCWNQNPGARPEIRQCGDDLKLQKRVEELLTPGPSDSATESVPAKQLDLLDDDGADTSRSSSIATSAELIETVDDGLVFTAEAEFTEINPITTAGFGDIFMATHRTDGQLTLKLFQVYENQDLMDKQVRRIARKATTWLKLTHPNVLPFLGALKFDRALYLVSPYVRNGTLADYLRQNPAADRPRLLRETAAALLYLRRSNIIHGNVKASNILVSDDMHALLYDFGLSRPKSDSTSTRLNGAATIRWLSPELWKENTRRTFQSDMWAFGMTIYEVLSDRVPFHDYTAFYTMIAIIRDERPPTEPSHSPQGVSYAPIWGVAVNCWEGDPNRRPSIEEAHDRLNAANASE